MNQRSLLALLFLLLFSFNMEAQQVVSNSSEKKPHSPHKATIYSAILPGLGQLYNRKYWKIPVVYAGIGTIYYLASTNAKEYRKAREAYDYVSNGYEYPIDNDLVDKYSAQDLQSIRDFYRRNMELSWIVMGLWYVLNIVDATVDAHFFDYDISDDLSLRIAPAVQTDQLFLHQKSAYSGFQPGISVKVRF